MNHVDLTGLRVAVLAADGFEQVELTSPVEALEAHGAEVEIVSVHRGRIRGMNHMYPGRKVSVDRTLKTADAQDYDAVLLPGGLANPDTLRQDERALDFIRAADRAGKPIAMICHAPWLLISAGLMVRRNLTSWPGIRDDVRNAGGAWSDLPVVRDRNWVSSRGPHDLPQFNRAMLELFAERATVAPPHPAEHRQERGGLPVGRLLLGGLAVAGVAWFLNQRNEEHAVEYVEVVDMTPDDDATIEDRYYPEDDDYESAGDFAGGMPYREGIEYTSPRAGGATAGAAGGSVGLAGGGSRTSDAGLGYLGGSEDSAPADGLGHGTGGTGTTLRPPSL
ncbi:type 1 glutamine amidotransferase domain-containing protein [Longimicrobium sp.]|jgi:protease I|uniref:type 1 glutamine amidotransferase domain-containing protein n=1 Tax=Longimicrobium sp. TaxID=2029185 RepID=UPI002ED85C41